MSQLDSLVVQLDETQAEIVKKSGAVAMTDPTRESVLAEIKAKRKTMSAAEKQLSSIREQQEKISAVELESIKAEGELEKTQLEFNTGQSRSDEIKNEAEAVSNKLKQSAAQVVSDSDAVSSMLKEFLPESDRVPDVGQEDSLRTSLVVRVDAFSCSERKTAEVA